MIDKAPAERKPRIRKKQKSKKQEAAELRKKKLDILLRDFQIERMINVKVSQALRNFGIDS